VINIHAPTLRSAVGDNASDRPTTSLRTLNQSERRKSSQPSPCGTSSHLLGILIGWRFEAVFLCSLFRELAVSGGLPFKVPLSLESVSCAANCSNRMAVSKYSASIFMRCPRVPLLPDVLRQTSARRREAARLGWLVLILLQEFRQPRDIRRDPPRLVFG
jgi:hypothetical protein